MREHRDNHLQIATLLRTGTVLTTIAQMLGMSRPTIYTVKKRIKEEDDDKQLNRQPRSGQPCAINLEAVKRVAEQDPTESIR